MCKLLLYGFNISYSFKLFIVLSSVSANELKLFVNERSERASCLTIFNFNSILLLTGFFVVMHNLIFVYLKILILIYFVIRFSQIPHVPFSLHSGVWHKNLCLTILSSRSNFDL